MSIDSKLHDMEYVLNDAFGKYDDEIGGKLYTRKTITEFVVNGTLPEDVIEFMIENLITSYECGETSRFLITKKLPKIINAEDAWYAIKNTNTIYMAYGSDCSDGSDKYEFWKNVFKYQIVKFGAYYLVAGGVPG